MSPGLFGTALNPIQGTQPQTPAPHPSGDGAPAQVSRPPLKPNVPCETQPPIASLYAPTGAGPQPINTTPTSPAALLRRQSAGLIELAQLERQARQAGLSVHFVSKIAGVK
jgi:hypothetical protein